MNNYPFTIHDLRAMVKALLTTSRYAPAEVRGAVEDEIYKWLDQRQMDVDDIRREKAIEKRDE